MRFKISRFQAIWQKAQSMEYVFSTNPIPKKTVSMASVMEAMKELHIVA